MLVQELEHFLIEFAKYKFYRLKQCSVPLYTDNVISSTKDTGTTISSTATDKLAGNTIWTADSDFRISTSAFVKCYPATNDESISITFFTNTPSTTAWFC
jgi:hypothetical protein